MTEQHVLMTPEEREIAVRGWTRYCHRGIENPEHLTMCRRLRKEGRR